MKTLIAGDRPTISDWPGGSSKPAATRAPVERAEAGGMLVVARDVTEEHGRQTDACRQAEQLGPARVLGA